MSSTVTMRPRLPLRMRTLVVSVAALAVAVVALLQAAPARANVPFQTITGTHPIRKIFLGNDLSCQVQLSVDSDFDFFPPAVAPGDCGTFLASGGVTYGPNFGAHDGSAATGSDDVAWTPVSQSPVSGSGSAADPFRVTTVVSGGGFTVTEVDSYVNGQNSYHSQISVSGSGSANLYHAGDCYLAGSDLGYGAIGAGPTVLCTQNPNNSPSGRFLGFIARTAGANFLETDYSSVWDATDSHGPFPNTADTTTFQDNGAGLQWGLTNTGVFDLDNVFQAVDPFGNGTGVTLGGGGVHLSSDFRTLTFVMHCGLPTTAQVPCDPFLAVLINIVNGTIHRGDGKGVLARQTGIASGQASILPGQNGTVTLGVTKQGQKAFKKRAKKVKKLLKKAKKLKKAGDKKKAKKLRKKAKKLRKVKAHISVNNDRNGATASLTTKIKLP